ncbi:hypothetical protein BGX29_011968 [Mortierella sp. GBA35]|nr:hypothetical protein BGX29_011968 [Mortierella sp. GBA35]
MSAAPQEFFGVLFDCILFEAACQLQPGRSGELSTSQLAGSFNFVNEVCRTEPNTVFHMPYDLLLLGSSHLSDPQQLEDFIRSLPNGYFAHFPHRISFHKAEPILEPEKELVEPYTGLFLEAMSTTDRDQHGRWIKYDFYTGLPIPYVDRATPVGDDYVVLKGLSEDEINDFLGWYRDRVPPIYCDDISALIQALRDHCWYVQGFGGFCVLASGLKGATWFCKQFNDNLRAQDQPPAPPEDAARQEQEEMRQQAAMREEEEEASRLATLREQEEVRRLAHLREEEEKERLALLREEEEKRRLALLREEEEKIRLALLREEEEKKRRLVEMHEQERKRRLARSDEERLVRRRLTALQVQDEQSQRLSTSQEQGTEENRMIRQRVGVLRLLDEQSRLTVPQEKEAEEEQAIQRRRLRGLANLSEEKSNLITQYMESSQSKQMSSPERSDQVESLRLRLENALRTYYDNQELTVRLFGSFASGLSTKTSNANFTLCHLGKTPRSIPHLVMGLRKEGYRHVDSVLNGRVPVVGFIDHRSAIECEISFRQAIEVKHAELMFCYHHIEKRVLLLWFSIRRVATVYKILSSICLRSSFGLCMMMIVFLQDVVNPPILPRLQQQEPCRMSSQRIKRVTCAFDKNWSDYQDFGLGNKQTPGELLVEFCHFFGHQFDYANQEINPALGRITHRTLSQPTSQPTQTKIKVETKTRAQTQAQQIPTAALKHQVHHMFIASLFENSTNVARDVSNANEIKEAFRQAYQELVFGDVRKVFW